MRRAISVSPALAKLLLVLFGLALVGLLEAGLRLAGFGGPPLLLVPAHPGASAGTAAARLWRVNPLWSELFFPRRTGGDVELIGGHRGEVVELPKPAGTVRVVLVGASTVEGFPHPRHLTAAAFLEEMLADALPGRSVEVVNLGVTAIASFPVRVLATQALAELEPDLLVILAGHNEFFGAGGVASAQSLGRSHRTLEWVWALRRTGLYQAAARLAAGVAGEAGDERRQLIEVMAALPRVEPGGPLHAIARENLVAHLGEIVDAGREAGVPVVLATLASNERDLAPIASWQEDGSVRDAGTAWRRALASVAKGDDAAAAEAFRQARDLDAMPWRASRDKSTAIRELARRQGVPLVDVEAGFAAVAGGPPGWRLFDDHVHPSLAGQALLARQIFERLRDDGLLGVPPDARVAAPQTLAQRLGANRLEAYATAHKMATLFSRPPLAAHNGAAAAYFREQARSLERRATTVEREALRRWRRASREAGRALPISFFGAAAALDAGRAAEAVRFGEAAFAAAPPESDERAAAALMRGFARASAARPPADLGFGEARTLVDRRLADGPPSPLLAGTAALLAVAEHDLATARDWEAKADAAAAGAEPAVVVLWQQLPRVERIAPSGAAADRP